MIVKRITGPATFIKLLHAEFEQNLST